MSNARVTIADWISDVACPLGFVHATRMSDLDYADTIIAALDAAGFAIVPKEPTTKMLMDKKAGDCWPNSPSGFYRAMISAAKETT